MAWTASVGVACAYDASGLARIGRRRRRVRIRRRRRWVRTGALLAAIGLMRLARAVRPRWLPLLAGSVLTAAGLMARDGAWSMILLPGFLLLLSVPLVPPSPDAGQKRRSELERELSGYVTAAQQRDLGAILDRYPDSVTCELRDILASQAIAASRHGIPGAGRF
ncbi:MAG: hypothetical protein LBV78_03550 [Kitasatospora sp.]|jgi:hypothetical protein|nr:hypothetical protein [Kitasatospora sp.]